MWEVGKGQSADMVVISYRQSDRGSDANGFSLFGASEKTGLYLVFGRHADEPVCLPRLPRLDTINLAPGRIGCCTEERISKGDGQQKEETRFIRMRRGKKEQIERANITNN